MTLVDMHDHVRSCRLYLTGGVVDKGGGGGGGYAFYLLLLILVIYYPAQF